ncbi:hypothetical protein [Melittangium boletus]|uniref:hypothetical protein n=1 Tax=Melittangium boletus TaxID=83453 RepID=UPI003DA35776
MNTTLFRSLVASLALLAPPALAQAGHELSLGAGNFSYTSFQRPSAPITTVEVAYHRRFAGEGLWRGLRLGGGLRTGWPATSTNFPLEVFVQAQLSARLGPWEPALGPELGVSGFAMLFRSRILVPGELGDLEDARLSPAYVAFVAAPLRFHFGPVTVSALELNLGTSVPSFGQAIRTQLGLVRLGWVL